MYTRLLYSLAVALAVVCIHAAPTPSPREDLVSRTQFEGRSLNVGRVVPARVDNNRDRDRLLDLVSRKTDIIVRIQIALNSRRRLEIETVELKIELSNMDRASDAAKGVLGRMEQAQEKGKSLEGDLGRLNTQLQGVQKEMDSVKAAIGKGVGGAPGKNSTVGAPGKNSTASAPGKNSNAGAPGKNSNAGDPSKNSTAGAPSNAGDPGKNSTAGAAGKKNLTFAAPGKNATVGAPGKNSTVVGNQ